MTDKIDAQIQRIKDALFAPAIAAGEASVALILFREEAGPKKSWSNHARIKEEALYRASQAKFDELGIAAQSVLPECWGMQTWGFRPSRMGKDVRWAGSGGKAMDGKTVSAEPLHLAMLMGTWAGYIAAGSTSWIPDTPRLKALGLKERDTHTFAFKVEYRGHPEATGHHPASAYANLYVRAVLNDGYGTFPKGSLDEAFERGADHALGTMMRPQTWSAAPTLWPKLRKSLIARKLAGPAPERRGLHPLWGDADPAEYDRALAYGLDLLAALDEPKGKMRSFLLRCNNWCDEVKAWCPTSAALARNLQDIDRHALSRMHGDMQIFEIAHDDGKAVRSIAQKHYIPHHKRSLARYG